MRLFILYLSALFAPLLVLAIYLGSPDTDTDTNTIPDDRNLGAYYGVPQFKNDQVDCFPESEHCWPHQVKIEIQ